MFPFWRCVSLLGFWRHNGVGKLERCLCPVLGWGWYQKMLLISSVTKENTVITERKNKFQILIDITNTLSLNTFVCFMESATDGTLNLNYPCVEEG